MENPNSYVHSNIAGLVTLLEACKSANPQPAVVWASSSSVYATKKAGEEITHTYNHIYGLSITGLRFFTVYGPWGRPDMAYFSFTRNILQGKPITVFRGKNRVDLARDFTYIDDIVKGCLGSLDTSGKSTGSGEENRTGGVEDIQLGEYIAGDGADVGEYIGEAFEGEGKRKCGGNAWKRRRSVYSCEY
ncbi:UDP-glucuronate 4-epimerase 1, partial [Cucurbita argyrosperma subsp. argyrosperma]